MVTQTLTEVNPLKYIADVSFSVLLIYLDVIHKMNFEINNINTISKYLQTIIYICKDNNIHARKTLIDDNIGLWIRYKHI